MTVDIEREKRYWRGTGWKARRKQLKRQRMAQNPNSKANVALRKMLINAALTA